MICIRFYGGLGNQMFQYAAGRALAVRHQTGLVMDLSALAKSMPNVTVRSFELGHFLHVGKLLDQNVLRYLPWLHRVPALLSLVSPWRVFVEKGTAWQPGFDKLRDQTCLIGYWQSHRYFSPINQKLANEFEPADALSPMSQAVDRQIAATPSVAVHVRRGDYVSLASAAKFHGTLPVAYYAAALRRISAQVAGAHVFVFSDDPQWCQQNLPWDGAVTYVSHNTGADAWQDLVLMGRCKHHVIANSSFSWWGAWLGDQRWVDPGRYVIAPPIWFAGALKQHLQDRYPPHWEIAG
jgi:hypothetical protein